MFLKIQYCKGRTPDQKKEFYLPASKSQKSLQISFGVFCLKSMSYFCDFCFFYHQAIFEHGSFKKGCIWRGQIFHGVKFVIWLSWAAAKNLFLKNIFWIITFCRTSIKIKQIIIWHQSHGRFDFVKISFLKTNFEQLLLVGFLEGLLVGLRVGAVGPQ